MTEDESDRGAISSPSGADDSRSMEERRRLFFEASERIRRALDAKGVTEQDIQRDFEAWRATRRSRGTASQDNGPSWDPPAS
jgi:hypothetical protein